MCKPAFKYTVSGLPVQRVWMGLNDLEKEGAFVWFDGTNSTYRNWLKGQPNNYARLQHCVEKLKKFEWRWNDVRCGYPNPFFCKLSCL